MSRLRVARLVPVSVVATVSLLVGPLFVAGDASAAVAPFSESFERAAVGSLPTSATTSYDQSLRDRGVTNGSVAAVIDAVGVRGHSVRVYNTRIDASTFGFLGERVGAQKVIYLRRYYNVRTLPAYRMSILLYKWGGGGNGQLGGTHNGSFAIGGTGQGHRFTLVENNTNRTQSKATTPVGSWFRVEVKLDFSSGHGVQTVRLFLGSNVNGTTPTETLTGPLAGTYTDYVEDGMLTNPNVSTSVRIDEAVNAASWPGPVR